MNNYVCPKCDSTLVHVKYQHANFSIYRRRINNERLRLTCALCGYVSYSKCKDNREI